MLKTHRDSARQPHDSYRAHTRHHATHDKPLSSHKHATESHKHAHRTGASSIEFSATRGRDLATLCVIAAFFGTSLELLNAFVAHTNKENTNLYLSLLSTALATVAIGFGTSAQLIQLKTWSHRARNRILIGLPVAVLTLVATLPNFWETPIVHDRAGGRPNALLTESPASLTVSAPKQGENTDLIKPGWYGETQHDGLLLVVTSFDPMTTESRRFNGDDATPVSYATFTVINIGRTTPVVLTSLQTNLILGNGKSIQSLDIGTLLEKNPQAHHDLRKRLALPQELAIGNMLADVPICMKAGFSWSDVTGVSITLGTQKITLQGRLMTADEKKALLEKNVLKRPAGDAQSGSAESWFKNL